MSDGPISSYIDIPSVRKETDDFLTMLKTVSEQFDNLKNVKVTLSGANSYKDIANGARELKGAQDELATQQQKLNQLQTEQAKKLAEIKLLQQQQITANKDTAKETLGMVGAYERLNKEYKDAAQLAKSLAATYGIQNKAAQEAAAHANELNDKLKAIDASIGEHKRKVGDYVGAITILEKAFQDVKEKMDQMTMSGQENSTEFQKLQEQYGLLETLTSQQAKGFSSVTTEIRANERALQSLNAAGLQNTETFKQLQTHTAEVKQGFNELARQQKILSSEAPALSALTVAAKGLAGMYAIGAGASALFANGNEKVDKEIQKLVAVMTVLQGLEEANRLLKERGAIAIAFQTAATKAAIIWQKLYTFAIGESTGALRVFRIALASTGIGALLLLLPLLVKGMETLTEGTKKTAESMKELNEQLEIEAGFMEDTISAISKAGTIITAEMEQQGKRQNEVRSKNIEFLKKELDAAQEFYDKADENFQSYDRKKLMSADVDKDYAENYKKANDVQEKAAKKLFELKDQLSLAEIEDKKKNREEDRKSQEDYLKIARNNVDEAIDMQKQIADAEIFSLADRLKARQRAATLQKSSIIDQANFELTELGLSSSQRELIISNRNKALRKEEESLAHDLLEIYGKTRAAELESLRADTALFTTTTEEANNAKIAIIQKGLDKQKNYMNEARDYELAALEKRKTEGTIKEKDYQLERLKIIHQTNLDILKDELSSAEQLLSLYQTMGVDTSQAEAQIASIRLQMNEENNKKILKSDEDLTNLRKQKYKELADALGDLFQTIVDAGYDNQKNAIQDQIDLLDQKKAKDTEVANQAITNEQDKAAAIATINARAANQTEALQRRQRQLDEQKARFDKAFNVAKIIESTSIAVVKELGDDSIPGPARIGLAALIGALGAVEIAKVIATPIPKYAEGTEDHPGGLAIVGDGGRSERITLPDGRSFDTPNRSTLMNLPAGTAVHPDALEAAKMAAFKPLGTVPIHSQRSEMLELKKELKDIKTAILNKPVSRISNTYSGVQQSFNAAHRDWQYIQDNTNY